MGQRVDFDTWGRFTASREDVHLLQLGNWGRLKSEFGWQVERLVDGKVGAQILFRPLFLGMTLAYIPRGPIGTDWQRLVPAIDRLCRANRAIAIKVEPDAWEVEGEAPTPPKGFVANSNSIQPARTITLDLQPESDAMLARMKQKTRYNIRLARRKGVVVRETQDVETFNQLIQLTGERDAFGVHAPAYYRRVFDLFNPYGMCGLLTAEYEGRPLAALMVFSNGKRAWYLYGASSNELRNYMPTYLLQWEAIRWAKDQGCSEYDLWGVPDHPHEDLERSFGERSDGLWGVYRFKRGFGGEVRRAAGPWDRVYNPIAYRFYQWWANRGS